MDAANDRGADRPGPEGEGPHPGAAGPAAPRVGAGGVEVGSGAGIFPDLALLEPLAEALALTVSELLAGERGSPPRRPPCGRPCGWAFNSCGGKCCASGLSCCAPGWCWQSFCAPRGFLWVRDHTELLPQGESWVTPRSLDQESQSLLQATGGSAYAFDVSLADDNEGYKLQLELWTEEGMEECWPILEGAGRSPLPPWPAEPVRLSELQPAGGHYHDLRPVLRGPPGLPFTVETPLSALRVLGPPPAGPVSGEPGGGHRPGVFWSGGRRWALLRIPASVWGQYDLPPRDGAVLLLLKLYVL